MSISCNNYFHASPAIRTMTKLGCNFINFQELENVTEILDESLCLTEHLQYLYIRADKYLELKKLHLTGRPYRPEFPRHWISGPRSMLEDWAWGSPGYLRQ